MHNMGPIWHGADLTWDRFDWGRFDLGRFDLGPILFGADLTCYRFMNRVWKQYDKYDLFIDNWRAIVSSLLIM